MVKYYAGIGSRSCPYAMQTIITQYAWHMERAGFILRSGGAEGADQAFEKGVGDPKMKEILVPIDSNDAAEAIAATIHPNWPACNRFARFCHGRNVMQVLGRDLKTPAEVLIAWTPQGREVGGSRTALVVARQNNIPIFNLGRDGDEKLLMEFLYANPA